MLGRGRGRKNDRGRRSERLTASDAIDNHATRAHPLLCARYGTILTPEKTRTQKNHGHSSSTHTAAAAAVWQTKRSGKEKPRVYSYEYTRYLVRDLARNLLPACVRTYVYTRYRGLRACSRTITEIPAGDSSINNTPNNQSKSQTTLTYVRTQKKNEERRELYTGTHSSSVAEGQRCIRNAATSGLIDRKLKNRCDIMRTTLSENIRSDWVFLLLPICSLYLRTNGYIDV